MHRNKLGSGNSFGTSAKRCELSWTGPIERNVLARIRCPLKLEAERIDGTRHRLAPGYKLSGSGFRAGWVHELRIFSRQACRASQSLSPGLHFARDFCSPLSAVGRDLIGDPRTLRTPKLPTFREQCGDETQESSCTSVSVPEECLGCTASGDSKYEMMRREPVNLDGNSHSGKKIHHSIIYLHLDAIE